MVVVSRWSLIAVALAIVAVAAGPETVKIDGGQIAGTAESGVGMFKGISFAALPVGELR